MEDDCILSSHVGSANTLDTLKKSLGKFIDEGRVSMVRDTDGILRYTTRLISSIASLLQPLLLGEGKRMRDGALWCLVCGAT